jgi:hypothetical protein
MKDILTQSTVLVLNRNWRAIHVKTPAEAFCMMASGAARGLDMQGEDAIVPVTWSEWLALPVREQDRAAVWNRLVGVRDLHLRPSRQQQGDPAPPAEAPASATASIQVTPSGGTGAALRPLKAGWVPCLRRQVAKV